MNLTPSGQLTDNIAKIERRDLEKSVLPAPSFNQYLSAQKFLRIASLAKFWGSNDDERGIQFEQLIEDLVVGLYGLRSPFSFLITGEKDKKQLFFTIPNVLSGTVVALTSLLIGTFPEVRLQELSNSTELSNHIAPLPFYGTVTGIPTDKAETKESQGVEQIERLIRGLQGNRWAYLVVAQPIEQADVVNAFDMIAEEIRNTQNTMLLKGTVDEANRLAQYYAELLEAALSHYKVGRNLGMWQVGTYFFAANQEVLNRGLSLLSSIFSGEKSQPQPIRTCPCQLGIGSNINARGVQSNIPIHTTTLSSKELAVLIRLPKMEVAGYSITDYAKFDVALPESSGNPTKSSLAIGTVLDNGRATSNWFEIKVDDLTKHGLVAGMTGSGKTNTCMYFLNQLWQEHKIPFLVIEPAKSEYRDLANVQGFEELQVFTLGDETVAPFRLNPFEVQQGVHVQTHIDYLKSVFNASFVLYAPMPYVLEQSIHEIYEDRGWELAANRNRRGKGSITFPTLTNLYHKVGEVVDRLGYDERISMDVQAGLRARIHSLRIGGKGMMLDTRKSIKMEQILNKPTVLELKQVGDDEEKAFLIGLLLMRLYEYYIAQTALGKIPQTSQLRHVTLIEEAHRLLKNVQTEKSNEESANPKGKAVEAFCHILSEIRAYGEGILIAEQIPVKLASDAIKNTNLKVLHRIVALDDREAMGGAMNLDARQKRYVSTLACGIAAVYAEGADKPYLLQIPDYKGHVLKNAAVGTTTPRLSDADIKRLMDTRFYHNFPGIFLPFDGCAQCQTYAKDEATLSLAQSIIRYEEFEASFSRFFLSIIEQPSALMQGYSDVLLSIRHFANAKDANEERKLAYCAILCAVEQSLDTRGKLYDWAYSEQTTLEHLMHDIATKVVLGFKTTNTQNIEAQIAPSVQQFQSKYRTLCQRARGPFVACTLCKNVCLYRYDVSRLLKYPMLNERFAQEFTGEDTDEIVSKSGFFCVYVAQQLILHPETNLLQQLGLCYAAQKGAQDRFSFSEQIELGKHALAAQMS